jgi:hypothetical protein
MRRLVISVTGAQGKNATTFRHATGIQTGHFMSKRFDPTAHQAGEWSRVIFLIARTDDWTVCNFDYAAVT